MLKEYHFAENLSLDDIAEEANLDRSYLSRLFKKETGQNIFQYLNDLRMKKAAELILKEHTYIHEVAAAVKTASDFDSSMSQVAVVSGATGDELEALREKAREMGASTKFSASEAADAMNYMAMAGRKTEDMPWALGIPCTLISIPALAGCARFSTSSTSHPASFKYRSMYSRRLQKDGKADAPLGRAQTGI